MSVFLSWSGADRDVKDFIADKLEQENLPFWESDAGCMSDFSKECIANIRKSSVFVVIISEASMDQKSYVFNEVLEARAMENEGKLNILVYRITDQPYTERFAMQLNHITDTNHVARRKNLGALGGVDLLISRIKYLLKCRAEGKPEKPFDVYHPNIAGTKPLLGSYFVQGSRDGIIERINEGFKKSNAVILTELFGFGKKSVVRKYISEHNFDSAIEIQGAHDSLYDFFLNDLKFTNINDGVFEQKDDVALLKKKFEFLSKLTKDEILVISDVDIEGEPNELLLGLIGSLNCRIIIITQNTSDAYRDYLPVIDVGRMEYEHLTEMFFHYYDRTNTVDREPLMPALTSFFDDIGGHTKTVEVAASVLAKEMKSNPEEVVQYLTRGSNDERELNDRIIDTLSGLISMQKFSESEQKILLVISLLANPIIEIDELKELLSDLNVMIGLDLFNLNNNRWIVYDRSAGTVYIEPIIARIFASKFIDYSIAAKCYAHVSKDNINSIHKDSITIFQLYLKLENMLRVLDMDEAADLVKIFRATSLNINKEEDRINAAVNAYTKWYEENLIYDEENASEKEKFVAFMIASINISILPVVKMSTLYPLILNFSRDSFSKLNITEIISEMFDDLDFAFDNDTIQQLLDTLSDDENETHPVALACSYIQDCFLKNDTNGIINGANRLVDILENSPECLMDTSIADDVLVVVKIIHTLFSSMQAYSTGKATFERLISLGWPDYHLYRILLLYVNLLVIIDEPVENVLPVIEDADRILEIIISSGTIDKGELKNLRREHALICAQTFSSYGMIDEAIEKFDEFAGFGISDFANIAVDVIDTITTSMFREKRIDEAIELISNHKDLIQQCVDHPITDEHRRGVAESILSLLEYNPDSSENQFTTGGEKVSESYYQRYSSKKGNGFVAMLPFNRVADAACRFDFSGYTNEELKAHVEKLRERAAGDEDKMKLAPEAFALVSEAGQRVLGYRHHRVQYIGAAAMLKGNIAEILNGEGKTYTIPLVAFVNSLYCEKVFIVDDSDYLTTRNYKWMRGIYSLLGLNVGHLAHYAESSVIEDNDIIYSTFVTLGFYVDNREVQKKLVEDKILFKNSAVIIDEADSILVERAKLPILIAGKQQIRKDKLERCQGAFKIAQQVYGNDTYYSINTYLNVSLKNEIDHLIESTFGISIEDINVTSEIMSIKRTLRSAIYAFHLVEGTHYFVKGWSYQIENTDSGTLRDVQPDIGYFLARINNAPPKILQYYERNVLEERITSNIIHTYELLTRFGTMCGTSATASSFKKAFMDIYNLDVIAIPPVLPVKRIDKSIALYTRMDYKERDVIRMIEEKHEKNQPILLIAKNIQQSTRYSSLLSQRGIEHKLLNATNSESSPEMLGSAGVLGSILVTTQMANRGVDIKLGGDAERMTLLELISQGVDISRLDEILYSIPSEEVQESELYRIYNATLTKNRMIVAANRDKVIAAGGLCVIGTEPYFDMRIEQQMRGRAGRQGAPGESYIFECVDDDAFATLFQSNALLKANYQLIKSSGESGSDIIYSKALVDNLEKIKKQIHANTYKSMVSALEESNRMNSAKTEFLRLIDNIDSPVSTMDEILQIWAINEENYRIIRSAIENQPYDEQHVISIIYKKYRDICDPKMFISTYSYLVELAKKTIQESGLCDDDISKSLENWLYRAYAKHVTQMIDLEYDFRANNKKANKMLSKIYETSREECIANAVNDWLLSLITSIARQQELKKRIMIPIAKPKNTETTLEKSNRLISRNDPCPCGSGKKYKNCCGNNSTDE